MTAEAQTAPEPGEDEFTAKARELYAAFRIELWGGQLHERTAFQTVVSKAIRSAVEAERERAMRIARRAPVEGELSERARPRVVGAWIAAAIGTRRAGS